MNWGTYGPPQAVESCKVSIEDQLKRCNKHLMVATDLVEAMDNLCKLEGQHSLHELGAEKLYTKAVIQQKQLTEEWDYLEKQLKKEKKKK